MATLQISQQGSGDEAEIEVIEEDHSPPWLKDAPLAVVGKGHPRLEGNAKVTGRARYSYDVRLPGQLYAKVLRSPHPHDRIDTSAAERLPGMHAVLSSASDLDIAW